MAIDIDGHAATEQSSRLKKAKIIKLDAKPGRLSAFSDGMFPVITILVLELKPPRSPNVEAFVALWPTTVSYAINTSSSRSPGPTIASGISA